MRSISSQLNLRTIGVLLVFACGVLAASCSSTSSTVAAGTSAGTVSGPGATGTVSTGGTSGATAKASGSGVLEPSDRGLNAYTSAGTHDGTGKEAIDETYKGTGASVDAMPDGSCQSWLKRASDHRVGVTILRGGEDESVIETVWRSATRADADALFAAMRHSVEVSLQQQDGSCRTKQFGVTPSTFAPVVFDCGVGDRCIKGEDLPIELINNHACKFSKASPDTTCNHSWTVVTQKGTDVVVVSVYSKADTPPVSPIDLAGIATAKL